MLRLIWKGEGRRGEEGSDGAFGFGKLMRMRTKVCCEYNAIIKRNKIK